MGEKANKASQEMKGKRSCHSKFYQNVQLYRRKYKIHECSVLQTALMSQLWELAMH